MKTVALALALFVPVVSTGGPQVRRSAAADEQVLPAASQAPDAALSPGSRDDAQALQDVEDRQGPFMLAERSFTVVLHYKRSTRDGGLGVRALASLEIRDAAGAVQYQESFPFAVDGGAFTELCSAEVTWLQGSSGAGLLIESGCVPTAPLAGGPWRIVGVVGGRLVPFGQPLVTDGEWGEFVPGAITRTANLTQILPDVFSLRVWTGYFFVPVPVRIDWQQGKLAPGRRCMYQTGHGLAEEGCEVPVEDARVAHRGEEMTFVRMFRESNERSGPPTHVVVRSSSTVEITGGKVAVTWDERPEAIRIAADDDVWVKIRIDGQEGWIHTPEDLNAVGLFASG